MESVRVKKPRIQIHGTRGGVTMPLEAGDLNEVKTVEASHPVVD